MRRTFFASILTLFACSLTALTGCSSGTQTAGESGAAVTSGSVTLSTEEDKTVYALGLVLARNLNGLTLSSKEVEIVQQAIADSVAGKPAVDLETYGPKINEFAGKRLEASAAAGAAAEKAKGKEYAEKAAKEPGAQVTPSGLVYRETQAGTGKSPTPADKIRIHYRGTFLDGKEFDSSYKNGAPAEFELGRLIPCWIEGIQKMKVGGKAQLVCPSDIAYGDTGRGEIPGGATLLFEVELLGIL